MSGDGARAEPLEAGMANGINIPTIIATVALGAK